ncbi:helix-turn-helix transcriptional regulator [Lentzea sp. PSKA42]|uniref:Helix-turn-helix transcriptional regulator n=1 Tax=Lentzea indica TaxID=2604800 RepID=A0ABX1FLH9_9PSEU|nr:helix-turn-helix domain-containing protein [Lentzea indica]NKE59398.1 helix-turn-helix transcriptional regulator [Lentzea indica]
MSARSMVGRIIHARRRELGMTQVELAARLCRTQQWVSLVEKGKRDVQNLDDLRWVAAQLDIQPERFGLLPVAAITAGVA